MKKNLTRIILLVIVSCMAIAFISCKRDNGYVIPSFEPGTVLEPKGRIKATTYLRSGNDSEIAFDKWIKAYNEIYPNVVVKPDIIEWSALATKVAAGDIGDVYYGCEQDVYTYAVTHRAAMALDAYVDLLGIDVTDVFTGLYDLGCANGLLYMVPSDLNPGVLYTNKTMLAEAGVPMPKMSWNYEEFKSIAKAVTKENDDGTIAQCALNYDTSFPGIMRFMVGFGGNWVDKVNKRLNLVSDENCLKGVTELIELIDKGYVYVSGLTGPAGAKFANISDVSNVAFTGGTYISRIGMDEQFRLLGLDMDVINFFEFPAKRVIVGGATGFFVYSKTKNPDAAATFCCLMLQDAGQQAFNSTLGGGIPTTKSNYEADFWKFPLDKEKFNYDAFVCYPEAFIGNWPDVYTPSEVAKELNAFATSFYSKHFSNAKDYRDNLRELEEKCNQIWATLYSDNG